MKRTKTKIISSQPIAEEAPELARIVPIRTETTLTRFPFHRIAKKGEVKIKQTKLNERGKVITTWEVKNPPGPLAYKLDTIIVNRRIDEMRNKGEIRKLIKLGSLRSICEELGISPRGKNTGAVREALHENGGAYVRANLDYIAGDGTRRTFEFGTSRYAVILTGEELPDGKKADAVYLLLHDLFLSLLEHSKTRPLDYEYLKGLPPSAQRLYELLSFSMFGTLKHGRPNTQMLYSEFCQSAPLTRYQEWDRVRPQMWKIHKPHIDAGYIEGVKFEVTTDETGAADWVMKYTPGWRARNEFGEFTTKRGEEQPTKPRLVAAGTSTKRPPEQPKLSDAQADMLAGLQAYGVTEEKGIELLLAYPERVARELESFPHRDRSRMKDPASWLIRAIEKGNYTQPPQVEKKRRERANKRTEERRRQIELQYRNEYAGAYLRPLRDSLAESHPEAAEIYAQHCARLDQDYPERPDELLQEWKLSDLETLANERPEFGLLTFWQWLNVQYPEIAKG
jgi:hypothetical protein